MSLLHVCRLFQGVPCQTHAAAIDTSARKHVYSSPSAPFLLTKKMKFTDLRTNSCMTEGQTEYCTVLLPIWARQGGHEMLEPRGTFKRSSRAHAFAASGSRVPLRNYQLSQVTILSGLIPSESISSHTFFLWDSNGLGRLVIKKQKASFREN